MAAESGDEFAVPRGPELDAVVKTGGGDIETVGGEGYVVDLLLMAQ